MTDKERIKHTGWVRSLPAGYIDEDGHVLVVRDAFGNEDTNDRRYFIDRIYLWQKNGTTHRDDDKPSIIHRDGSLSWYKKAKLHRFNRPAYIDESDPHCLDFDAWKIIYWDPFQ